MICFGHFEKKRTFIWGGTDSKKAGENLFVKWDSVRSDFEETSIDELKLRVPYFLQLWLHVAKTRHEIKGSELLKGVLTRLQTCHLKTSQAPLLSTVVAKSRREVVLERVLFQDDLFCVQNSVRNLYPDLVSNVTFNEALTGLGTSIKIRTHLPHLLQKHFKTLRLVLKRAGTKMDI